LKSIDLNSVTLTVIKKNKTETKSNNINRDDFLFMEYLTM